MEELVKGELVSLRRLTDDDYELLVSWLDGQAGGYANGGPVLCSGAEFKAESTRTGHTHLMIVSNDGTPVGALSWRTLSYPGNFSIGLIIGESQLWGRGHAASAFGLLLQHLFHTLNAHRVEVTTGVYNQETMKIVTRGLMTLEGILRDYAFVDGEYQDVAVCSLLRTEYETLLARGAFGRHTSTVPAQEKQKALNSFLRFLSDTGDLHLHRIVSRRQTATPPEADAPHPGISDPRERPAGENGAELSRAVRHG